MRDKENNRQAGTQPMALSKACSTGKQVSNS